MKCPKCGMDLVRMGGVTSGDTPVGETYFTCPHHSEVISDKPGTCPKCGMALEKREKPAPTPAPKGPHEHVYTCPHHPEVVSDKPGTCPKCGMDLVKSEKTPAVYWTCPMTEHADVVSDKPGKCPKCDMDLVKRQHGTQGTGPVDAWICPLHPEQSAKAKGKCPECGGDLKYYEYEQVLSVPISAIIDTGARTVVFIDRGHGTFDAVEVKLGHRAGEYYEVLGGLAAGDRVVTAGAFLLDSETRLNPAAGATYFGASDSAGPKGHEGHK